MQEQEQFLTPVYFTRFLIDLLPLVHFYRSSTPQFISRLAISAVVSILTAIETALIINAWDRDKNTFQDELESHSKHLN